MAEKKDQKEKKVVRPATIQREVKSQEDTEVKFFAEDLAAKMGIDNFEFLLIKREAGLDDNSVITMSEMQKLYNKIIRR